MITSRPRIIAVQTENCAPLARAFTHTPAMPKKDTLAEGIAIAEPVRGKQIIQAVKDTGGHFIMVNEDEIRTALLEMCRQGYYIEPTSAATIAGIKKYLQSQEKTERVVSVFTGHGLKASEKIAHIAEEYL